MNFLITGGNSGIGLEILNILSKNLENNFFILSKKNTNIKNYKNTKFFKLNLDNTKKIKIVIKKILKQSQNKIDVVICNAAQGTFGPINMINLKDLEKDYNTNFFSHLIIIKSILPSMIKRQSGHIINIASGTGLYGLENLLSYALGKSSMQILIETIKNENINNNIFAKNIYPGITQTDFQKKNKFINKKYKNKIIGKKKEYIAKIIVKNIFSKKLNIFCQSITRITFLMRVLPFLNTIKKFIF